jgi:hypothetical protein
MSDCVVTRKDREYAMSTIDSMLINDTTVWEDAEFVNRPVRPSDIEFGPKKKPEIVVPKDRQLFIIGGLYLLMPKNLKKPLVKIEMHRYKGKLQYFFALLKRAASNLSRSIKGAWSNSIEFIAASAFWAVIFLCYPFALTREYFYPKKANPNGKA